MVHTSLPIYVFMDNVGFSAMLIQLRSLSLWKYVKYIKEISQFGQFYKEMVILCLIPHPVETWVKNQISLQ